MRPTRWLAGLLIVPAALGLAETITPERGRSLDHLIRHDCGSCHGMTLKGGLGTPLTPAALAHADAALLTDIILDGIPGTPMPPWRPLLSTDEARWIADYLLEGGPE